MRERKQNSVTFCFDSIAGKMIDGTRRQKNSIFCFFSLFTNMRTFVRQHWLKRGEERERKYILSFYIYTMHRSMKKQDFWRDARFIQVNVRRNDYNYRLQENKRKREGAWLARTCAIFRGNQFVVSIQGPNNNSSTQQSTTILISNNRSNFYNNGVKGEEENEERRRRRRRRKKRMRRTRSRSRRRRGDERKKKLGIFCDKEENWKI